MQNRTFQADRWGRVARLYEAIESRRGINEDDGLPFATDIATRWTTLELLRDYGMIELFPEELYSVEQAAIGNLVMWLEFPTELDAIPDEIEYVEPVTINFDDEGNKVYYHVFKFRVDPPHWAAEYGWMLSMVGPYFDDSKPEDHPHATFSRLSSKFGETSPADEARWVHENISMR